MSALLFIGLPAALIAFGLPIFLAILVASLLIMHVNGIVPEAIQPIIFGSLQSFPLLAVPLFIVAGEIMGRGGIARRIVDWVLALLGGVRGALPLATVASSEMFGTISGSSLGCMVAVGRLLYPSMRENGYGERFSVGIITSAGAIAIVVPPSIAMILYSLTAQQSLTKLFAAGILPGVLIGALLSAYIVWRTRAERLPLASRARWGDVWEKTRDAGWSLGMILVIFGGIYGGIFTPTEAAGVAVVYAIFVTHVVHREMPLAQLWEIFQRSATLTGSILIIVAAANVYSWLLTASGLPAALAASVQQMHLGYGGTMLIINAVLLIVGSVLEPPAAILILVPVLLPLVTVFNVDPIHFGIVAVVNLSIGMFLPPFGLNIFAAKALFGVSFSQIYRGVLPFVAINIFALFLIVCFPLISLAIPRLTN